MLLFFFFKQKTAYEMRISDWSSDVCSSDLLQADAVHTRGTVHVILDARGFVAAARRHLVVLVCHVLGEGNDVEARTADVRQAGLQVEQVIVRDQVDRKSVV